MGMMHDPRSSPGAAADTLPKFIGKKLRIHTGANTGRRADLFIIDDPIKGRQDADSQTIRDVVWNWYQAEVITRLKSLTR